MVGSRFSELLQYFGADFRGAQDAFREHRLRAVVFHDQHAELFGFSETHQLIDLAGYVLRTVGRVRTRRQTAAPACWPAGCSDSRTATTGLTACFLYCRMMPLMDSALRW